MTRVFPLSANGAAGDVMHLCVDHNGPDIQDLTAVARFGLKGPRATEWFEARGIDLPPVNRQIHLADMTVLRLGKQDIMLLADPLAPEPMSKVAESWRKNPTGYSSWREEAWAWLRVTGPTAGATLSQITTFDFRESAFDINAIAQTRVAHQDMVLCRTETGFDLLFDIAATAQVVRDLDAARKLEDRH